MASDSLDADYIRLEEEMLNEGTDDEATLIADAILCHRPVPLASKQYTLTRRVDTYFKLRDVLLEATSRHPRTALARKQQQPLTATAPPQQNVITTENGAIAFAQNGAMKPVAQPNGMVIGKPMTVALPVPPMPVNAPIPPVLPEKNTKTPKVPKARKNSKGLVSPSSSAMTSPSPVSTPISTPSVSSTNGKGKATGNTGKGKAGKKPGKNASSPPPPPPMISSPPTNISPTDQPGINRLSAQALVASLGGPRPPSTANGNGTVIVNAPLQPPMMNATPQQLAARKAAMAATGQRPLNTGINPSAVMGMVRRPPPPQGVNPNLVGGVPMSISPAQIMGGAGMAGSKLMPGQSSV